MEVEIRRRETVGAGSDAKNESETLAKFEIMDGAPVRGETIPIRLYLSSYDLAPTYSDVHNKFSVRYFLNLVLVDEEDRRGPPVSHYGGSTMGVHYGGPLWGVHYGGSTMGVHYGGSTMGGPLWGSTMGVHYGGPLWGSTMGSHYGGPLWGVHYGGSTMGGPLWGVHYGGSTVGGPQ
eukprot:gene30627-35638_t